MSWNRNIQNVRVFNWTEILEEWNDSLNMPRQVQTFINNLQAASGAQDNDPNDYPLSHFLTYLNNEQDGLKWFVYEIVAMRWMWGESRLDYLRQLVDRVENLDSQFPHFPGRPATLTVREYLETHLSNEELEFVNMMPRLLNPLPAGAYTPPFRRNQYERVAQQLLRQNRAPPASPIQVRQEPIELRFIRKEDRSKTKNNKDDVIVVAPSGSSYKMTFRDGYGETRRQRNSSLTRQQVLQRLSLMLRLAQQDEDGFASIQMSVPAMPSVLFGVTSLSSDVRDMLYDMVEMTMDDWPVSC